MVQHHSSPIQIFKYPFEIVMAVSLSFKVKLFQAYEKRFPTCPQFPIVVETKIVDEFHSGSEWIVERECKLNIEVPYLLKRAAGLDFFYVKQKNSLNKRKRTLRIETNNISFPQRLQVKELCTYYVHPENKNWTCFTQRATLDIKSFFGFEGTVEKIAITQFSESLVKSKEVLEHYIQEVNSTSFIQQITDLEDEETLFD